MNIADAIYKKFSPEEREDFSLLAPYILVEIHIKYPFLTTLPETKKRFYETLLDIGASVLDARLFVETKLPIIYEQMKRYEALGQRHPVLHFF